MKYIITKYNNTRKHTWWISTSLMQWNNTNILLSKQNKKKSSSFTNKSEKIFVMRGFIAHSNYADGAAIHNGVVKIYVLNENNTCFLESCSQIDCMWPVIQYNISIWWTAIHIPTVLIIVPHYSLSRMRLFFLLLIPRQIQYLSH